MTPDEVLSLQPKILSQKQRERYFEDGFILLEKFLPDRLGRAAARRHRGRWSRRAATVTKRDAEMGYRAGPHAATTRGCGACRARTTTTRTYWDYASAPNSPLPDAIADLVGPDVKFHHSKLNFKWSKGGAEVKWHQDIPAWPHTNYSPCTAGTYIYDCGREQGPLAILQGQPRWPDLQRVQRQGPVGRLPVEGGRSQGRHVEGRLSRRPGRLDHHPQLPGPALLGAKPFGRSRGRCCLTSIRRRTPCLTPRTRIPSKHAGAIVRGKPATLGPSRSAPLPAAAGLVERLHLALCRAGGGQGRRRHGRHDVTRKHTRLAPTGSEPEQLRPCGDLEKE